MSAGEVARNVTRESNNEMNNVNTPSVQSFNCYHVLFERFSPCVSVCVSLWACWFVHLCVCGSGTHACCQDASIYGWASSTLRIRHIGLTSAVGWVACGRSKVFILHMRLEALCHLTNQNWERGGLNPRFIRAHINYFLNQTLVSCEDFPAHSSGFICKFVFYILIVLLLRLQFSLGISKL